MKKIILIAFLIVAVAVQSSFAQKVYATFGSEMIFSLADIDNKGRTSGNILRWAPVINLQLAANFDFGKHAGMFLGVSGKNVGFIYDWPDSSVRKKFRNYTIGIPVGIKLGVMNRMLIYTGYEIEFPFSYKEKTFINDTKSVMVEWFSTRVPAYYHSAFIGVQFPYGLNLKFKYYFSEFFNQDYTASDGSKPYQGFKANVWYISLGMALFQNHYMYYKEYKKNKHKEYY